MLLYVEVRSFFDLAFEPIKERKPNEPNDTQKNPDQVPNRLPARTQTLTQGMTDEGTGHLTRSFDSHKTPKSKDWTTLPSKSKIQSAMQLAQRARKERRMKFQQRPAREIYERLTKLNQDYFRKKKKDCKNN